VSECSLTLTGLSLVSKTQLRVFLFLYFVCICVCVLVPHKRQNNMRAQQLRVSDNLASDVSAFVKAASEEAISERGKFVVALSGGSLPSNLLPLLQDVSVDFSKWHVFFVDERFVPLDSTDSNFRACASLLAKVPPSQVYAINPALSLDECAVDYEKVLLACHFFLEISFFYISFWNCKKVSSFKLDLVLLGMGEDGHTASLFPNHALLAEKSKLVVPISDSPKPPPSRVTMTFPLICSAKQIAFVAGGAGKQDAMKWIFAEKRNDIPARIVIETRPDTIFFTDQKAVAKL
jgi:6-phosphogluconolactonase